MIFSIRKVTICFLFISAVTGPCFAASNQISEKIPEYELFKNNPWLYMEEVFIKDGDFVDKWDVFKEFVALVFLVLPILSYSQNNISEIPFMILVGYIICLLCRISGETSGYKDLEEVFKSYDPDDDLSVNEYRGLYNNRMFIPKELSSTFDTLYSGYVSNGVSYLKKNADNVLNKIKELIKKQNSNKYYRQKSNILRNAVVFGAVTVLWFSVL